MSSSSPTASAAILDAARRLLELRGYYGIGLDGIAREAGVSRQAIYLHFKSKAGLLLALVEHVDKTHDLAGRVARIVGLGGAKLLDALVTHDASYTPLIYRIATVLDTARRTDHDVEVAWQNRMADRYEGRRRVVMQLAKEGVLAPGWSVEAATDLLWALTSIRVWEDLVVERGWSKARYVRHLRTTLRTTLLRKTAPKRRVRG